jgi:hypothetical protein
MRTQLTAAATALTLFAAACAPTRPGDNAALGADGGAAVGFLTAKALNANPRWTVVAALAGAAAGTLVARNTTERTCAYSNGDGTYYTVAC